MKRALPDSSAGTITASVRTPRMTMRISGALDTSLPDIFVMVSGKNRREAVLEQLAKVHADMTAREEARG